MRKLLALTAILATLTAAGCSVNAGADTGVKTGDIVVTDTTLADGYYLSDNDNSYIHINDGKIELCNFDIAQYAEESYEKEESPAISLDEWINNAKETFEPLFEYKEYTPVRFVGMGENGEDLVWLIVDYEFAAEHGAYTGYEVQDDATIIREGNTYTYSGETL